MTVPFDYPMVVRVAMGSSCTGTLIDPNHVLTAAHCVQSSSTGSVTFEVESPRGMRVTRTLAVSACHMNPGYTHADRACLKPELRGDGSLDEIVASLGDRCGVLAAIGTPGAEPCLRLNDAGVDLAVLQLARPIPPSALRSVRGTGAGDVFVDPASLLDPPASAPTLEDVMAVGYGRTSDFAGIPGIRRYKHVARVLRSGWSLRIDGFLAVLAPGDSGGPFFSNAEPGFVVAGVAHRGGSGQSEWSGVGVNSLLHDWVISRLDLDADGRSDSACPGVSRGVNPLATPATDPDGDGYLDFEDDCPGTYNPCQLGTDMDGDHVNDDCDACPNDPSIHDLRGQRLPDFDGDGTPDICDCQRTTFNPVLGADPDHDFVPTEVRGTRETGQCDNCPSTFNPDQSNRDEDATGDVCDPCPDDLNVGQDWDADGVDDACDNCVPPAPDDASPWYNPLQENCNIDAEQASPVPVRPRGDICDPVPCGETTLGTSERNGTLASGRPALLLRMDRVLVDARSTTPQKARTGFRFCRCSGANADEPQSRNTCKGRQLDGTGFCVIGANGDYRLPVEVATLRWRQTIMQYPVSVPTFEGEPRREAFIDYDGPTEGSFEPNLVATWKLEQDQLRWSSVFSEPFEPDVALPGVLWTHTPGGVDASDTPVDFPDAVERLTSHYWSGVVAAPMEVPTPFPCLHYVGPYLSNAGCPFCGPAFPGPFLALPGHPGLGCGAPFEPPVLAIPDLPFELGPLLPVDPAVLARPDLRWLAPSEPVEWLPADGTRLLALDSQLQAVVRLVETGQGLGLAGGQGGPGCPNCDTTGFPQASSPASAPTPGGSALPAAAPSTGSTPSDAVLVLSARQEKFWELRGDAHSRRGLVIAHPLDPAQLYHVDHLALGHVLAATYRAQDEALYVLDEVTHGRGWRRRSQARLLRISTDGAGVLEVLARWPRLSWNTRFALVAAPGEAVWLVASPEPGRGPALHVVLRVEARRRHHGRRARWRPSGFALGFGTLAHVQPRLDARGLSLVVERRGQEEAIGYAQGDLHGLRARDLRRCF
ncbi:MAG: trypsin-like serine protease [Deltaproteobacteria bacterium]|nr:trypsin-like serine protease [Deltaproteobacteria bacterium]